MDVTREKWLKKVQHWDLSAEIHGVFLSFSASGYVLTVFSKLVGFNPSGQRFHFSTNPTE